MSLSRLYLSPKEKHFLSADIRYFQDIEGYLISIGLSADVEGYSYVLIADKFRLSDSKSYTEKNFEVEVIQSTKS